MNDIKSRIDSISTFPAEVEKANYSVSVFRREVISVAVSGDLPELDLRQISEQVRDEIAALSQISYAELNGIRDHEISIEIEPQKLQQAKISLAEIVNSLKQASIDFPAGSIKGKWRRDFIAH